MAYNYEYPYTDPNRFNADWLLNKVKNFDATDEARKQFKELIDSGFFAKIFNEYNKIASASSVNIYVSYLNGNDENSGTKEKPIKSTTRLMDTLKNIVNGSITIYIDNTGVYDELSLENIHADAIVLVGTDTAFTPLQDAHIHMSGLGINNCTRVYVQNIYLSKNSNYVAFIRDTFVLFDHCYFYNVVPSSSIGATENSCIMLDNCILTGRTGVSLNYLSRCFAHNTTVESEIGFWPKFGSIASHSNCTFSPVTNPWIYTESGSLQLSEIGNITHATMLGNLSNDETITFDSANISKINKIRLTIFLGDRLVSVGVANYNNRNDAYEFLCIAHTGSAYNIGFFTTDDGNVTVTADIAGNVVTLHTNGVVYNNARYMIEVS